ncbi:MAG: hypothetical protein K2H43_00815, partial [Clostridia bacterium]|nr:hypothetical protein [Clostridia bacterium]
MRPDGDTLGCGLALSRALDLLGIRNQLVNESEIPEKLRFLEGIEKILRTPTLDAEAYICVDTSDETRLGELQKTYLKGANKGRITVNLDHHVANTRFAKYNFVRDRASNCENIAELIRALGVKGDRLISGYLMTGMITDSGSFSHSDVNGDTFREAAYCADGGADVNKIHYEVFKRQTKPRALLYAETISHLRFLLNDALAIALVTQDALKKYGLKQDATEGIVDFALSIDPVEVSVCLMEAREGQYKASFRSKGKVNVNEAARTFGGGGHILASGCMVFGPLEEVCERITYAVAQAGNL